VCACRCEERVKHLGIQQTFLIGGKVKVLLDDVHVAGADKRQKVVIPSEKDCNLTIKCGINLVKGKRLIRAGQARFKLSIID